MKIVFGILGLLAALLVVGIVSGKVFFTSQVMFILIFVLILAGGVALLKFIQRH
ncbi:MAG: hypothetical protein H6861_06275 [Rhodospirillales bacterium]|nr:hypothetical protein [Rhodospirillales bacterium]